jgi:AraC family transcriptional activator of tynA and feaB
MSKKIITTEDVEVERRVEYWKNVCKEHIGSVEVRHQTSDDFNSSIAVSAIGLLKITHFRGVTQELAQDQSNIKSSDTDDYAILVESNNRFMFDHNGRQHVGRGNMVFIDWAKSYNSHHPDRLDVVHFHIPRKVMERVLSPAQQLAGLSIAPDQASFPILLNFLRSLQEHGESLDPASAERMSSIAVELIAASMAERIAAEPLRTLSSAATLYRAQAYIADKLGVSGLGMQEVAAATGVSVRRLQEIAAEGGISLKDWMWDRRLDRAKASLSDPAYQATSVQTVALNFGFVDQAHFSKRFKQRFGMTPSEAKAMQIKPNFGR